MGPYFFFRISCNLLCQVSNATPQIICRVRGKSAFKMTKLGSVVCPDAPEDPSDVTQQVPPTPSSTLLALVGQGLTLGLGGGLIEETYPKYRGNFSSTLEYL